MKNHPEFDRSDKNAISLSLNRFAYICPNTYEQMKIDSLKLAYLFVFASLVVVTLTNCEHEPFEPIEEDVIIDTGGINDTTTVIDSTDTTTIDSSMIPSFSNEVKPIINIKCATTYCHGSGAQTPPLTDYSEVSTKASRVKARTAVGGGMPLGGTLTAEQIEIIAKWVDGGAPNN